jgi:hypothetical protein
LDLTKGIVIVDGKTAGTTKIADPVGVSLTSESIELDPLTFVIIKM